MTPERALPIAHVYPASSSLSVIDTASLADGRTALLTNNDLRSLELRFLDSAGTLMTGEVVVAPEVGDYVLSASIAVLADQTLLVTWSDVGREPSNGGSGVAARHLDANGNYLGPVFAVNASSLNDQDTPLVAALPDGGFVIVWTDHKGNGIDPITDKVMLQRFDAAGSKVGEELQISGPKSYASDTVVLRDGNLVVSWNDQLGGNVKAQLFGGNGAAIGEEFILSEITSSQGGVKIGALANGGFVAAWNDLSTGSYEVKGRLFSSEGGATSDEFLVNSVTDGQQYLTGLNVLQDGGFSILWRDESISASGTSSRFQLYDADGFALGKETLVSVNSGDEYGPVSIFGESLNSFSAIWLRGGGGSDPGIKLQRFEGGDGILTATAAGSVVVGTGFDEVLIGLGGNDILLAGHGNDLLNGGAGNDILNGGEGIDTASFVNATKGVTVNLGIATAQGTFEGRDTLISIENIIGSAFADTLRGDNQANILDGGLRSDGLFGFGGSDILIGGEGADRLDGGAGADTLRGGQGSDTLTGGADADIFLFDALPGADTIKDFVSGEDKIALDRSVFAAFASDPLGAIDASALYLGTKATSVDHHLIYNAANGALFYDVDGLGGIAQIRIATLTAQPTVVAGDFLLAG